MKLEHEKIANSYSTKQLVVLTSLRILIGWHFLYEGLVKLCMPEWTAKEYLNGAVGLFAPLFKAMAGSEFAMTLVDTLNVWGLILIGLSLFIGLLSKPAKIFGIVLLAMYYLAYPPFPGLAANMHAEGSYWIVNKNLIEIAALSVLYFFPSNYQTGIDRFLFATKKQK
ncbi:DoxX subfamily [Maribellus sp. YY47]|uniref:DoxX subfamily n=1 Tax=Maribellus sp. YY47 TaxID=2929486 RepID=UPI002001B338|nr:DoxX subfamily [Maribellus sp. YY47]MCK3685739.1 DoxX subfamily [Maribellus sp. YY47]